MAMPVGESRAVDPGGETTSLPAGRSSAGQAHGPFRNVEGAGRT